MGLPAGAQAAVEAPATEPEQLNVAGLANPLGPQYALKAFGKVVLVLYPGGGSRDFT